MATQNGGSDDESLDSELEYEFDEGIPQPEDEFIQKYMDGRNALIEQEKKQRHDRMFKLNMSPLARQAAKIMASLRKKELQSIWTSDFDESLSDKNGGNLYPGMMFSLARDRMQTTELWKIIEKMPKGALLHAHLDAMIDVDWLVDQALNEKGLCLQAAEGLSDKQKRSILPFQVRYYSDDQLSKLKTGSSIWTVGYEANAPVPIRDAQRLFPDDDTTFKKWIVNRCTITPEESLQHHHGLDAVWEEVPELFPFDRTIHVLRTYIPERHVTITRSARSRWNNVCRLPYCFPIRVSADRCHRT